MTDPTYAQASTATDQATYRARLLATLAAPTAPLQAAPVAGWSNGAPQRLLVDDFATQMATESTLRAKLAQTVSPQTAANVGADWVYAVLGWFDETPIAAVASVWDVELTVSATSAPLTIDNSTVIQIQASTGQIFLLTQSTAVVLNSASSYLGTVRFTARTAGTAGDAAASSILAGKILTGPAGLSIGPSTPTLVTAARDIETAAQMIVRCLGKWGRLGAGWTRTAFDYLIPAALSTVVLWRVDDSNPYGPGTVGVTIAPAAGVFSGSEATTVEDYLNSSSIRPLGSGGVTVTNATADALTVNVTIQSDGSNSTLETDAEAAALALAAAFPIGPATFDNVLLEAVLLGGAFASIPITAGTETITITPTLPGFAGAVSIVSIDLAAPHAVPDGERLVLTCNVTVT